MYIKICSLKYFEEGDDEYDGSCPEQLNTGGLAFCSSVPLIKVDERQQDCHDKYPVFRYLSNDHVKYLAEGIGSSTDVC